MKTSSVEFISRSPTPSPMKSKHRRFAMLRRIFQPWQWKRRKKRDRFEQTSRTLAMKISMRSTKELIKKGVLMPDGSDKNQDSKINVFLLNLPDIEEVFSSGLDEKGKKEEVPLRTAYSQAGRMRKLTTQRVKDLLKHTLGNAVLTYEELLTVLCDCESIVNSRPLTYVSEDSDDLIPLTPAMFMMSNASLDVTDLDLSDFARFQKRVKFRARLLKNLRGRFRKEYLGLLVQKAHKTTRVLKVGEIVLIENPNKKRLYWPLGKVIELIPVRDGKVRILKLRCSNSEIIRPIQRVFPLEIQSAEMDESNDVPLDGETLTIPSAGVDVSESAIPVNAPPNMPKVSRYGRTIQRPRRLNVFNVTTVFESE
ncbi:integrase catalytic domain-containing protein [Trichonephila clavipes]|nr:integrase catalytic domain-containing protein [Trichonephila clavipes]